MNRLQIADNQGNDKNPLKFVNWCKEQGYKTDEILEKIKSDLEKIANVRINKLSLEDNPNLLVFPQDLNRYGDKIGENHIISLRGDEIATGNIMGFVGVNQTQIDIRSRFAQTDGNDYFLHYMLQKVFAINLFDLKHDTSAERIFDFLFYLFPHFLRKAVAQGVFKKYRRFEHNDANIRGPIDVSRHIRQNIPFRGTVAYTTREHTYDNELTQLVRHTIEFIRGKEQGQSILNNDADTKTAVSQIVMATPTYNARERAKIVSQNLRPVRHPYFSAYTDLQRLCLQILRHEELKYGRQKDQIYGILFDGAWLWEEYLNTILKDLDFKHPRNKESRGGIRMFEKPDDENFFDKNSRRLYPDFWKENFILDAKYKRLDNGVGREDLYQVVTYMHCMKADNGGFVYPVETESKTEKYGLAGYGGTMRLIGLQVQYQCGSYTDYVAAMKGVESNLLEYLKQT
ncbi:MAG: hypothetical protein IKO46_03715 [Salinivirgaceae bacterium]|nr:hypothetical protein [Salinivirgaceae bacterium]